MRILITNDDGISAPGLLTLVRAARNFGQVTVAAPAGQCSGMSHRITAYRPLTVCFSDIFGPEVTAFSVDGSPADCVRAALDSVLTERPDVVLSGINSGYNVGIDILYSGTVGAAMEALVNGIPAIAVSRCETGTDAAVERYLLPILSELLEAPPARNAVWNVNFPGREADGILRDRVPAESSYYTGSLRSSREGDTLTVRYPELPVRDPCQVLGTPGSDLEAVTRGYVSVGAVVCPVLHA